MNRRFLILLLSLVSLTHHSNATGRQTHDKPLKTKIAGKIYNRLPANTTISLRIVRVGLTGEELKVELNNKDTFSFEFESYVPTDVWLIPGTSFQLLVHPGDSLYVELDGSKNERSALLSTIRISGDRGETNSQVTYFQRAYYGSSFFSDWSHKAKAIKNMQPNEFKKFADSLNIERQKFLDEFVQANKLNHEAETWARLFMQDIYFSDLTFYPYFHRDALALKTSEWDVPLSYYDYFKNDAPNGEAIHYGFFINSYSERSVRGYIRLRVKDQIKSVKNGESNWFLMDSVYIETIKDFTKDSLLKEILLTKYFNDLLSEADLEGFERNLSKIQLMISSAFLKEPLLEAYRTKKAGVEKSLFEANVKSSNTEIKSDSSFIDKIVAQHKGKPLYIDVWATWCGPCLAEFPYSKKLKTELNVVTFIYICIDSKENAFQNTIKRFQLEGKHYFLSQEESHRLRKELDIVGIPTYILVDKKGSVLYNGDMLRPSEGKTKNKIVGLLKNDN